MRWLNRNVVGIGIADLAADANYEMVFAVLPLFITAGLGAPAVAVGLVEGIADGSSAVVKLWSGWYSDRIAWRKRLAVGGYGTTVVGLSLLVAITSWPQVIVARALAWMGRGLRQPIRSAMLAGSVGREDLGKAFGFHEALDTAGALLGPAVALALLSTGSGFRTVFWVALIPGVICVLLFALITRDPRHERAKPVSLRVPMPPGFWRLMAPVAIFGVGNFATAFFTLRAAQMVQPELTHKAALAAAVAFYLAHNAVGAVVSFPAGWLADRVGKALVLSAAYATFAGACLVGLFGHGFIALGLMALFVGAQNPVVSSVEGSLTSSIVEERRLGTGFGILNAVNGVGDLGSSIVAGVLWTFVSPAAALGAGAALCTAAALLLRLRAPSPAGSESPG
ncbi:MAG TPA: MFS transporter [Candidatus Dormibacteraeota bacterium]|nr:MFS transporter [Candidatus Dormibacteraeota bacterium]